MTRPSYGRYPDGTNTPTEILANTAGMEKIGGMLDNAAAAVKASLSTTLTGDNNDLVFTAKQAGVVGNHLEIALVDPSGNDQELAVTVADGVISVSLATGPAGAITSTAAQVKAGIEASATASALVTVAHKAGNDGTGVVTALAAANLTGGTDAVAVTTLAKGTVMGIVTATGLWKPYSDAANDGTEVAKAILADQYDINHSDQNDLRLPCVLYVHGAFVAANLTGLDANAITDLGGRQVGTTLYI